MNNNTTIDNSLINSLYYNMDIYLINLYLICACLCIYKNMLKKCNDLY